MVNNKAILSYQYERDTVSKVPLLTICGYAKKGEGSKCATEMNALLSNYQKITPARKSIYTRTQEGIFTKIKKILEG